jgi:RHS repeat-associated protein
VDGATYTYDNAGNRVSKTNLLNGITEQYTYDPLYQLTQVIQGGTTTERYTYDAVGNRLSSLNLPTYSYNSSNELTATSAAAFTYDANGNTLTKADSAGTTQYSWDFENRLIQAVVPAVGTTTFRYDSFGRRIQKSGPNGTVTYIYDGANVVEEVDSAGNFLGRYIQGAGIDGPLSELRSGANAFYEVDGLGSVTSLSSATGTILESYVYDSFGNVGAQRGSFGNPYRYTARDYDPETGLQYSRARYYDLSVGRFISEDPLGPVIGNLNIYKYVQNNPLTFVDPSGLQHSPGGPWHPDPWISYGCNVHDSCATLSWKIDIFKKIIASHVAWDLANNTNRHQSDIAQHLNGLAWCIELHQLKCVANKCPKTRKVPESAPNPDFHPYAIPVIDPIADWIVERLHEIRDFNPNNIQWEPNGQNVPPWWRLPPPVWDY